MTAGLQMSGRLQSRAAEVAPAVCVIVLASILLVTHGVPVGDVVKYGAYFLTVIVLPGRLIWNWLWESRRGALSSYNLHTGLEDWVFGAAVGYVLELVAYPLARWGGHPRLYVVVPILVLVVLGTRAARHRRPQTARMSWRSRWLTAAVAGYLTIWISVILFARTPMGRYWPSGEDETFHLALVGELRHHFPAEYPYVEAGRLTYQWFVHAHMAASTWITGLEPLVVYRRFDVLVLSLIAVLGVGVLTMRLAGRSWPGLVASGLLVLVGTFDITGTVLGEAAPEERFLEGGLLLNSPTQTFAFALVPPAILICLELLSEQRPSRRLIVATLIGMMALSGIKATVLPMFVAGFVASALISWWRTKSIPWAALAGGVSCGAILLLSTVVLYAGDSHSLRFEPGQTTSFFMTRLGMEGSGDAASLIASVSLLAMWLVSAVGLIGLLRRDGLGWDARVWWLLGAAASGMAATMLLAHDGLSQLYFGRTAAPILAVLSAWGTSELFPKGTRRVAGVSAVLVAIAAGLMLLGIRAVTEAWRLETQTVAGTDLQPALRLWVNLPFLLLLVIGFFAIRLVTRDLSGGARVLARRQLVVFLLGLGLARSLAFALGHYPDADITEANAPIPAGGVAAARWLRAHSQPGDRVITNAHCLPAGGADAICDSRHFWMSAFSERRFVLEGWAYTRFEEDWYSPFWGPPSFMAANDYMFTRSGGSSLSEFAARHRAKWVLVDMSQPDAKRPHRPELRLAFSAGDFLLFRIR